MNFLVEPLKFFIKLFLLLLSEISHITHVFSVLKLLKSRHKRLLMNIIITGREMID